MARPRDWRKQWWLAETVMTGGNSDGRRKQWWLEETVMAGGNSDDWRKQWWQADQISAVSKSWEELSTLQKKVLVGKLESHSFHFFSQTVGSQSFLMIMYLCRLDDYIWLELCKQITISWNSIMHHNIEHSHRAQQTQRFQVWEFSHAVYHPTRLEGSWVTF